jgi:hypothetical protein
MKRFTNILGRIALTVGSVAAIGWGFVALNAPDENGETEIGVQESQADIASFDFTPTTSTQRFQKALDALGHETPRVYDYNGNTVMFSTNIIRGDMRKMFDMYMTEFANQGVNPSVFRLGAKPGTERHREMLEAAVTGGVIPWVAGDTYASMGGAVMERADPEDLSAANAELANQVEQGGGALKKLEEAYERCGGSPKILRKALSNPHPKSELDTEGVPSPSKACKGGNKADSNGICSLPLQEAKDLRRRYQAIRQAIQEQPELAKCRHMEEARVVLAGHRHDAFSDKLKAFRSIEAWHDKEHNITKVTATWSDETFDIKKTQPQRFGKIIDTPAAEKIPLCPGCRRTYAFQGTGAESGYSSNIVISPMDPQRTALFYRKELAEEGWEMPESELVVDEYQRMAGKQSYDRQWLRMRRGEEFLALYFARDEQGRTVVRTGIAP